MIIITTSTYPPNQKSPEKKTIQSTKINQPKQSDQSNSNQLIRSTHQAEPVQYPDLLVIPPPRPRFRRKPPTAIIRGRRVLPLQGDGGATEALSPPGEGLASSANGGALLSGLVVLLLSKGLGSSPGLVGLRVVVDDRRF